MALLNLPPDRLVRKESALGFVREIIPPVGHIGLQLVPFMDVPTDDVIFNYITGDTDGLAPARAEDAESELAQKDDLYTNMGRASILDWALKDHYTSSDVSRYREAKVVADSIDATGDVPLFVQSMTADFAAKVARATERRRRKLDNRMEWLIMNALGAGVIAYNDGKITFSVDYGRPAAQKYGNAANTLMPNQATTGVDYSLTTHDPIGDIIKVQEFMYDTYGVIIDRALVSRKFLNRIIKADKFTPRSGFTPAAGVDLNYVMDGWGPQAAIDIVQQQTNVTFIQYDAVYRTRPIGSTTVTNNRFFPEDEVLFLPAESTLNEFDDTGLGFGKMLTSPHPMGNWTSGYYEWERETTDPWGYDVGTGIKAFPVFLHMDKTYAMKVKLT